MKQYSKAELDLKFLIEPQIRPMRGPIFFATSMESAVNNIVASGSFGLVDTGERKVLVTCSHVLEEYREQFARNPAVRMLVGLDKSQVFAIDVAQLVDEDRQLDLAVFDMATYSAKCSQSKFFSLTQTPAPKVETGQLLVTTGYPGIWRTAIPGAVEFGSVTYAVSVSDVSGNQFFADISNSRVLYQQQPRDPTRNRHGGISGSPCFLLSENRTPRLVGFTTSICLDVLRFTHARCLNSDGTIGHAI